MKPHRFDPVSFVFGALITLVGLTFLIPNTWGDFAWFITSVAGWLWPVVLLVLGLAVLLPAVMRRGDDSH